MPQSLVSVGSGGGGGTPLPSGGGIPLLPNFGSNANQVASYFVQNYQNKLGQKLAAISQLAKSDPAAAQQQLQAAWTEFLQGSEQFISSVPSLARNTAQTIVKQALSTPALVQTVHNLWVETGGQGGLAGLSNAAIGTDSGGPSIWSWLPGILAGVGIFVASQQGGGSSTGNTGQQAGTNGTAGQGTTPNTADPGFFDRYIKPFLPLAIQSGLEILGASSASNAAKEAAQIQSAAADKALALQERMYNQSREDFAPWRRAGGSGLQALSYGLGLPDPMTGQRFTAAPMTLARVGMRPQTNQGPQLPDLNAIAARYRIQPQGVQ